MMRDCSNGVEIIPIDVVIVNKCHHCQHNDPHDQINQSDHCTCFHYDRFQEQCTECKGDSSTISGVNFGTEPSFQTI